jgi:hypothetical protein
MTQQQPMTAIQCILPEEKISIGNAFVMFMQLLGGALFVSFGQTLFSNQLKSALPHFAPDVDSNAVFLWARHHLGVWFWRRRSLMSLQPIIRRLRGFL